LKQIKLYLTLKFMPQDLTSFQKDLVRPDAGVNSELYRAIAPLIDLDRLPAPENSFDQERLDKLKNDLRQGTLGLEYLTGLKKNKVETFFDAHPAQATLANTLGSAGAVGAGIGLGGGQLANALRQWKNFSKTENAFHARRADPKQEAGTRLHGVSPEGKPKPIDEDILRVFGAGHPDAEISTGGKGKPAVKAKGILNSAELQRRMQSLDEVSGVHAKPTGFQQQLSTALKIKNPMQRLTAVKQLMDSTRGEKAYGALKGYVDLHTDLQRLRDNGKSLKGGFGSSLGDRLIANDSFENLVSKLPSGLQASVRSLIPHSAQGVEDLIHKRISKGHPGHYSEDMLKRIVEDVYGVNHSNPTSRQDKVFNRAVFSPMGGLKNSQGYNRALRMLGGPALMGAGIAGAGLGLNQLLKMIQTKAYGNDQINEWKRNVLKSKGEFEEAKRIK
jgi:hypothetical protein